MLTNAALWYNILLYQYVTRIFGKENVQDEELWNAGFGICGDLIEVGSENISQYVKYKNNLLWEKIKRRD